MYVQSNTHQPDRTRQQERSAPDEKGGENFQKYRRQEKGCLQARKECKKEETWSKAAQSNKYYDIEVLKKAYKDETKNIPQNEAV